MPELPREPRYPVHRPVHYGPHTSFLRMRLEQLSPRELARQGMLLPGVDVPFVTVSLGFGESGLVMPWEMSVA